MSKNLIYLFLFICIISISNKSLNMTKIESNFEPKNYENIIKLQNTLNIENSAKMIFSKKIDKKIQQVKKHENLLIINLLIIKLNDKQELLNNTLLFDIKSMEKSFNNIEIIKKNKKNDLPIIEKPSNAYSEKLTKNLIFAFNEGPQYKLFSVNGGKIKHIASFPGTGQISNTGEFLYANVKFNSILKIFNKINPSLNFKKNYNPLANEHLPKLVNLKDNKTIKCFDKWFSPVSFSNNDKFFLATPQIYEFFNTPQEEDYFTLLMLTKNGQILKKFKKYSNSLFSHDEKILLISFESQKSFELQKLNALEDEISNKTELINTEILLKTMNNKNAKEINDKDAVIKSFENIKVSNSKFNKNNKLILLTLLNKTKKIFDIEKRSFIAELSENQNCGLTKNNIWLQDENMNLKFFEHSKEIYSFKNNIFAKQKQKNEYKNLCDTKIKYFYY